MSQALLSALFARRAFLLTQASLAGSQAEGFAVTIKQPLTVAIDPGGRKQFEQDRSLYRFAAGGGLVILKCLDRTVGLVRYRDPGAPSFGDTWTLGSGLSSSVEELMKPYLLACRGGIEEFIVAGPNGVLIPVFAKSPELTPVAFAAVGSGRHIRTQAGCGGYLGLDRCQEVEADVVLLPGSSKMTISFEGTEGSSSCEGLVVVDEGTRGIDLLYAYVLHVPYELAEIAIYDGEEDRKGAPLNAPVGCLQFSDDLKCGGNFVTVFQNGGIMENHPSFNGRMTPPLAAALQSLQG